jgi:hypothetical protein
MLLPHTVTRRTQLASSELMGAAICECGPSRLVMGAVGSMPRFREKQWIEWIKVFTETNRTKTNKSSTRDPRVDAHQTRLDVRLRDRSDGQACDDQCLMCRWEEPGEAM